LARPGKPLRERRPHRLPVGAAPKVFGVTAALCLSATAIAGTAASAATVHPSETAHAATQQAAQRPTELLSALMRAKAKTPESGLLASYTVRSGDSLSGIAQHFYHSSSAWPVIFWTNHGQIRWANEISTGQVLRIPVKPATIPAAPGQLGPAAAPVAAPAYVAAVQSAPVESAPVQAAPAQAAPAQAAPAQAAPVTTYSGGSGLQQCIISAESGGNSQVMNSSGHYGLYQFSASTWQEYGGSAGSFGNASVAEQNQVFNTAIAAGGASNWTPYDGC
jgi:nucleoid-associated protein YgaU